MIFDREIKYDKKSLQYPIRELIGDKKLRSYSWRHIQLDQGTEGACTGFSATMEAAARPKPVFGNPILFPWARDPRPINDIARQVYYRARQLDEWAGENYEGSSVLGAVKAGQEKGWWGEYRWALGPGSQAAAQDIALALGYCGPVMMGSYWYEGMFEPVNGYLNVTGNIAGGHAWLLTRYSLKRDAFWTPNSWGGAGQGWITRADLVKLLANDGEACIPVTRFLTK